MAALALAVVAAALLLPAPAAAQCQMCKTALTNSIEGRNMGQSFNYAILMMIAAPYLVAGTVAAALMRRQLLAGVAALAMRVHAQVRPPWPGFRRPR